MNGAEITRRQFVAVVAAGATSLGGSVVAATGPGPFAVLPAAHTLDVHRRLTALEARASS